MRNHFSICLLVTLALSGCVSAPSLILEQTTPSSRGTTEVTIATPFQIDTQMPQLAHTPSATITLTPEDELLASTNSVPVLQSYAPDPTSATPSLSKFHIINRTNVSKLVPVWRYEPAGDPSQTGYMPFDFSPDGEKIAFVEDTYVTLLDLQTSRVVQTFTLDSLLTLEHQLSLYSVLFSPGGDRLAGFTEEGPVLWKISSGELLWKADWSNAVYQENLYMDLTTSAAFSPGGDMLITTSIMANSDIRVWSTQTGKLIKELGTSNQLDAAFDKDGKRLYTADRVSAEEAIRIWDTETWQQIGVVNVQGQADSIVLSTNGERAVVGSFDMSEGPLTLEIYEVDGWKHIGMIEDRYDNNGGFLQKPIITSPVLNHDGGIVAFVTRGLQGEMPVVIQLWDVANQKHLLNIEGKFPTPIWIVRFSPDGRLLAAQSENGTTIFWAVPSQ